MFDRSGLDLVDRVMPIVTDFGEHVLLLDAQPSHVLTRQRKSTGAVLHLQAAAPGATGSWYWSPKIGPR